MQKIEKENECPTEEWHSIATVPAEDKQLRIGEKWKIDEQRAKMPNRNDNLLNKCY